MRVRKGRFSTSFVPASAASYRYAVIAVNDLDTDRGSTGWLAAAGPLTHQPCRASSL